MANKFKKRFIFIIILFFFIVSIIIYRWWWENNLATKVTITVVPESANILLNGEKISNGEHFLKSGKYTLKASHQDFVEDSIDFSIDSKENKKVSLVLKTIDGTDKWYLNHRKDDLIRSGVGYENVSNNTKKINEDFPITKHLPYTDNLKNRYTINYKLTDNKLNSIEIEINSCYNQNSSVDNEEYRKNSATRWLNSKLEESEKDKYEINYTINKCYRSY